MKPLTDKARAEIVFAPHWPEALETMQLYRVGCDDKGHEAMIWAQVLVAGDGDVHLSAFEHGDDDLDPNPYPTLRIRTYAGGGRNHRTHQALLWLALAMKLDAEEQGRPLADPNGTLKGERLAKIRRRLVEAGRRQGRAEAPEVTVVAAGASLTLTGPTISAMTPAERDAFAVELAEELERRVSLRGVRA